MAAKADAKKPVEPVETGWPPPRQSQTLIGHSQARDEFFAAMDSGRLAHAWMISGPGGIGKATFAYSLARRILGPDSHRLIEGNVHPNLMAVERGFDEKKGRVAAEIPVDSVRGIIPFLRMTASDGGWRVAIIDGADSLNIQGQNAILKTLEEPPAKSILFLTTCGARRLLPTILSRCRLLSLAPLNREDMSALLQRHAAEMAAQDHAALIESAGGSIGFALRLMADGKRGLNFSQRLSAFLGRTGPSYKDLSSMAFDASRADGDFNLLTEDILEKAVGAEIDRRARGGRAQLMPHLALQRLMAIWGEILDKLHEARGAHLDLAATWSTILRQLTTPERS